MEEGEPTPKAPLRPGEAWCPVRDSSTSVAGKALIGAVCGRMLGPLASVGPAYGLEISTAFHPLLKEPGGPGSGVSSS